MCESEWRPVTDEHIARHAAAHAGDEAEAEDAEVVVAGAAIAARGKCAAEGAENDGSNLKEAEELRREARCRRERVPKRRWKRAWKCDGEQTVEG